MRDLIHEIDFAGWLFGWPRAVWGRLRNLGRLGIEAEECADLAWETVGGALVSVSLDYLSRPSARCMCARGESGTLEWEHAPGVVRFTAADGATETSECPQTRDERLLDQDLAFLEQGVHCDERLATGEDGLRAVAVCDAGRRSSETSAREEVGA